MSASVQLGDSEEATALVPGDFDADYSGNVLPGTSKVVLTGKGNYAGNVTGTFRIVASEADQQAGVAAAEEIAAALPALDAISASDPASLSAVDNALAAYNELTDVQKTQVPGATTSALIAEQAKAAAVRLLAATKTDLSGASVTVASATYTGKALTPKVTVTLGKTTLKSGTDYGVTYLNNKAGGTNTATAVVIGKGSYTGGLAKQFTISAAANSITAPTKASVTKSYAANKKTKKLAAAQTIALGAAKSKFGTASWSVATADKKKVLSLNAKTGKVTVKKGAPTGTYTLKAKASVAKTASWTAASKTVTVKVTVKK